MKFLSTSLALNIKRIIKTKSFVFIFIILLATLFMISSFLQKENSVINIKFGIVFDENDDYSKKIYENITTNNSIVFEIFSLNKENIDELEKKVKTGEFECVYIIKNDIADKIKKGDFKELITLIKSPKTMMDTIVNEMFYASVIETFLPDITTGEIVKILNHNFEDVNAFINKSIADYYNFENTNFVEPNYYEEALSQDETIEAPTIGQRMIYGTISLSIIISTMFMLPRFIDEKRIGTINGLAYKNIYKYYFSLFISFFICNLILGLSFILGLKLLYSFNLNSLSTEIYIFLLYNAVVSIIGLFFVLFLKNSDTIYSSFIFILILLLCFGGIIFDLREINELLGRISNIFVTNSYINLMLFKENLNYKMLLSTFVIFSFGSIVFLKREY